MSLELENENLHALLADASQVLLDISTGTTPWPADDAAQCLERITNVTPKHVELF